MKKQGIKLLSVVVPCYCQEKTIVANLQKIEAVLKETNYDYEIIAVIDGKIDKTYEQAKKLASGKIKVVAYEKNHGKGYALRYGMVRSKGDVVAFIDAGQDLDPAGLKMLLSHFEWYDADIIVGSKWHPVSRVIYPWWRRAVSLSCSLLTRILFNFRVKDTQLGMKFFRRRVLEDVLPRLLVKKYGFDIELLAVATHLGYQRIYEAPVELDWQKIESNVAKDFWRTVWETCIDTLAVFYRLRIRHYYDSKNQRKWRYDKDLDFRVNVG